MVIMMSPGQAGRPPEAHGDGGAAGRAREGPGRPKPPCLASVPGWPRPPAHGTSRSWILLGERAPTDRQAPDPAVRLGRVWGRVAALQAGAGVPPTRPAPPAKPPLRAGPDPATARVYLFPDSGRLLCHWTVPWNVGIVPTAGLKGTVPGTGQGPRGRPDGPPAFHVSRLRMALIKAICSGDEWPCLNNQCWGQRPCGARGAAAGSPLPSPPPPLLALRGPRLRPRDSGPADVSPACTRSCNIYSELPKGEDTHVLRASHIRAGIPPYPDGAYPRRLVRPLGIRWILLLSRVE